jgi:nucleoside-diphosphate-sugar epimerase
VGVEVDSRPGFVWSLREIGCLRLPGGEDHVQIVDVKDVARFIVLATERSLYGTFNLTGVPMTFRQFVENCNQAMRSRAEFVWSVTLRS